MGQRSNNFSRGASLTRGLSAVLSSLLLAGCAAVPITYPHKPLGSTWQMNELAPVAVLSHVRINDLEVRHVRRKTKVCVDGFYDHLEIAGRIGPDSFAVIEKLLPSVMQCVTRDGIRASTEVYLSSSGGSLAHGILMGEVFRKHQVETILIGDMSCKSACAIAYLGGLRRNLYNQATLVFHAPYLKTATGVDCTDRGQVELLRNYMTRMLGEKEGVFLFHRTMAFCSRTEGWTINKDAAKLLGISR